MTSGTQRSASRNFGLSPKSGPQTESQRSESQRSDRRRSERQPAVPTRAAGARRLMRVVRVVAKHLWTHYVGDRLPTALRPRLAPLTQRPPPERLRLFFEELGGTYVKFGQMLALQPDILPMEYCNALFKLLDRVDPFPWSEVERIVEAELGRSPDRIFDHFETEPLATASVGQVHVAWLDGVKVAVKVQRPNVEEEFGNDIRLMLGAMQWIETLRLGVFQWMLEPMREFVAWTREELDYRYEARFSEALRKQLDGRPGQHVPRVFDELTTRRILVVEFLDGVTLLDYLRAAEVGDEVLLHRLAGRGFDRRQVASNVIDNFLANAFEFGVYHADLHPANLIILDDNVVGYIDFGITGVLNQYCRRHLMKMTLALARGDMDLFHQEFLRVTTWDETSDLEGFRAGLDELAMHWYEEGPDGPRLAANFTRVMSEMLRLSRRTNVMPERNVIKYIRSSIAIDGLVARFEPDFDLSSYLSARCSLFLRRERRSAFLDPEHLLSWAGAGSQLLHDGPARGARALDRLAAGELPVYLEQGADDAATERLRSLQLAFATFGGAVLTAFAPSATVGVNLLTAALIFTVAAGAALGSSLWRLGARRRPPVAERDFVAPDPVTSGSRDQAWSALGRTWDVEREARAGRAPGHRGAR